MPGPSAVWPLFGLSVSTPRLQLRYATDDLLLELTGVAGDVIQPGTLPFDGDATFYDPTAAGRRRWLAGQWSARARASPSWWVLVFAVIVEGRAVGTQEITASEFPALRSVGTFSWLTRGMQGRGLGREMREAVLHLAFGGLGAHRAESEAFEDNAASCGVSRAVGYERDGTTWAVRRGEAAPMARFVLTREAWLPRRRCDVTIHGLDPCLPFLGLT
jgi:RimJ/RimL family protein N-acetyltransferase